MNTLLKTYLEQLKSIDTLYCVSERQLEIGNYQANQISQGDFGEGIYLFASKEAAIANFKFLRHNQLLTDWQQQNTYQVFEYSLNTSIINTDTLTNTAWGYKGNQQNGIMVATELTSQDWFAAFQNQNQIIGDLIMAPICYYQLKYAPRDPQLSYMGYRMNTKILTMCITTQFGLNLLSYKSESAPQNAINLLLEADKSEKNLCANIETSFERYVARLLHI